jgi:hypothetical protein
MNRAVQPWAAFLYIPECCTDFVQKPTDLPNISVHSPALPHLEHLLQKSGFGAAYPLVRSPRLDKNYDYCG